MTDIHITEGFDEYEVNGVPVRIVMTDRAGDFPVLAVEECGNLHVRNADGTHELFHTIGKQKRKPREWYVEAFKNGNPASGLYVDRECCNGMSKGPVIKVREVLDDE